MNGYAWMLATKAAAQEMPNYVQELCLLDTEIGDGDHGVTIGRGYQSIEAGVEVQPDMALDVFCKSFSNALATNMGGAIGPVYGVFWKAFARTCAGRMEVDSSLMADAFAAAVQRISAVCQVKQGEKTMFDALVPTAEAMEANRTQPLETAMAAAVAAAQTGCESTRDMIAKKGRARFLAERSQGHIDAGAFSFVRWMQAWEKAMKERM